MALCCDGEKLGEILQDLLNALDSALVECEAAPCRVFLDVSDAPPWDNCCFCADGSIGQAYVTVPRIKHMNQVEGGLMRCQSYFEAEVKIGVVRCAVGPDDRGNPPDPNAISLQTLGVLRDRLAMNQAVMCVFGADHDNDEWNLGDWKSLGPMGNCVGGEVSVLIRFSDPSCE